MSSETLASNDNFVESAMMEPSPTTPKLSIPTSEKVDDSFDEIDEKPENLLGNISITNGWITESQMEREDNANIEKENNSDGKESNDSPQVFKSCKKLMEYCRVTPEGASQPPQVSTDFDISKLEQLPYVPNIFDSITRALNDVLKMSDRMCYKEKNDEKDKKKEEKEKKSMSRYERDKSKRIKSRLEVLEKQQQQLVAMQKRKEDVKEEEQDIVENESWSRVGESDTDGTKNDGDKNPVPSVSATHTTRFVFNSLRILIRILYPMINHPHSKDINLNMKDGPSVKVVPNQKKKQCYLFGEHMYSITTVKSLGLLQKEYTRVVSCIDETLYEELKMNNFSALDQILPTILKGSHDSTETIIKKTLHNFIVDGHPEYALAYNVAQTFDTQLIHPLLNQREYFKQGHTASVTNLHQKLTRALATRFSGVQLTLYGSCLSDLTLGASSDVDVSLYIPEVDKIKNSFQEGKLPAREYEKMMKNCVYKVLRTIENHGSGHFRDMVPITRARVPVVKGRDRYANNPLSQDGSLSFDICFLNDIAVQNSSLIREYSLVDKRVKLLMLAVKSWIKMKNIANAADGTLSSYTWMNMVIFYLQTIEFVPVLQCPRIMKLHGIKQNNENPCHSINGLKTAFATSSDIKSLGIWKQHKRYRGTPISILLHGFFNFYAHHFSQSITAASVRLGKCILQKTVFGKSRLWRICIEDPFEVHDSHCPHDLGAHLSEQGAQTIIAALTEAAYKTQKMLEGCTDISDLIGSQHYIQRVEYLIRNPYTQRNLKNQQHRHRGDSRHNSTQDMKNKQNFSRENNRQDDGNMRYHSSLTRHSERKQNHQHVRNVGGTRDLRNKKDRGQNRTQKGKSEGHNANIHGVIQGSQNERVRSHGEEERNGHIQRLESKGSIHDASEECGISATNHSDSNKVINSKKDGKIPKVQSSDGTDHGNGNTTRGMKGSRYPSKKWVRGESRYVHQTLNAQGQEANSNINDGTDRSNGSTAKGRKGKYLSKKWVRGKSRDVHRTLNEQGQEANSNMNNN